MRQKLVDIKRSSVYAYDTQIDGMLRMIGLELSQESALLVKKYDKVMISLSMSKAVKLLHLRILLSLSKMLDKNWNEVTKSDIDELVYKVMQKYSNEDGRETNSSSDHKKNTKDIFQVGQAWLKKFR